MIPRSEIRISKAAVERNYGIISKMIPGLRLIPMVKADAYGHGAIEVSRALLRSPGLYGFGVASYLEAKRLRQGLGREKTPIIVFSDSAFWQDQDFSFCTRLGIEPVFSEIKSLLRFQADPRSARVPFHVEVNTGMNRLGIPVESLPLLKAYPRSVFTHLADADRPGSALTIRQMKSFDEVSARIRGAFPRALLHFANSSTIWNRSRFPALKSMDLARPGLSLYGIRPFEDARDFGLKRVMTFKARVLNRIHLEMGDQVGYGGSYRCRKASGEWLAILGAGYADGIFRSLGNQGVAYFGSRKLRFRGRVSMDLAAIEGHSKLEVGDEVEIWGDRVDPYEQAALAGTIPYELTTRIGPRVERFYE